MFRFVSDRILMDLKLKLRRRKMCFVDKGFWFYLSGSVL